MILPRMPGSTFETALANCWIAWNDDGVSSFHLPGDKHACPAPADIPPASIAALVSRVQRHLSGDLQNFNDVSYDWSRVTPFQRAVYEGALRCPPGHTWSYGELTSSIGQPITASRAVGTALGQNPWPLLVPCHRFISATGHLTGFSGPGGLRTKLRLLQIEGAELSID